VFLLVEAEPTTAPLPMAWNEWNGRDSLKA
jgi:hypothetical protein